ncbi:MAG: cytochrome c3 family protein [Calditrichaceae bacterium]|nr:cytochrome c3 family protein [Calditrichia bacterium]NUQ41460.1 cytochrome c3 family protein [Calditrichaceae bacterium]
MSVASYKNRLLPWFIMLSLGLLSTDRIPAQEKRQLPEGDQCIICHQEEELLPPDFSENDVHLQQGLSCAGCHGGDPTKEDMDESMSPKAGFVGVPAKAQTPQFCGKCHSDINFMRAYQPRIATDQVSQFYTSVHGKKLQQGDPKVADCSSCHTAHAILSAKDPRSSVYALNVPATCQKCHSDKDYMKEYGISTTQYDEFVESVHGKALLENKDTGAPACNDCHGNHGAIPPGITSISHVCGTCHVNNMQYFATTKMAREFEKEDIHGCEECHGNHAVQKTFDDMVGVSDESVCMNCHGEGDEGYESAKQIRLSLGNLVAAYDSAAAKQTEVQRVGMDDVDIGFLLQESHQSLIQARTLVHTFDPVQVSGKTDEGIQKAREAHALALREIKDSKIRRMGFGVAALFATMLAVALFFKIREIERKQGG